MERYSFLSEEEPTDEQLSELMRDVGIAVRKRAAEADKKFREELHKLSLEALAKWEASTRSSK